MFNTVWTELYKASLIYIIQRSGNNARQTLLHYSNTSKKTTWTKSLTVYGDSPLPYTNTSKRNPRPSHVKIAPRYQQHGQDQTQQNTPEE